MARKGNTTGKAGSQGMVGALRTVILRAPDQAQALADPAEWHYAGAINVVRAKAQHDAFTRLIQKFGAQVIDLADPLEPDAADAVFTHDISLVTNRGAVILRPGKLLRRIEQSAHERTYQRMGVPILGRIESPGTVEGGDCLWLDERTLAVGCGFRTNEEGAAQLARLLQPLEVTVHPFDLPVWGGAAACLHLMSLISLLDRDLAIVHMPLLPVRLLKLIEARGVRCLVAPADEFERSGGMSLNVLALAPRQCVMVSGYSNTERLLRDAGCSVETFEGDELCVKMEGGPTCLSRPVLRDRIS